MWTDIYVYNITVYTVSRSSRNKEMEPKQKQHPVVNVSGGESKAHAVKNNIA